MVKSEYLISFSTIGEEIQFDQVFGLFGRFGQLSKLRFGNDYLPTYFNFASTRHLARKARSAVYVTYAGSLHSCKCLYNNSDFIFKKLLGVSYWAMISGTLATGQPTCCCEATCMGRTVVRNCKNPPKIKLKKIVKLIYHTNA